MDIGFECSGKFGDYNYKMHPRSQGFLPSHTDWALSEGKSGLWSRMLQDGGNENRAKIFAV